MIGKLLTLLPFYIRLGHANRTYTHFFVVIAPKDCNRVRLFPQRAHTTQTRPVSESEVSEARLIRAAYLTARPGVITSTPLIRMMVTDGHPGVSGQL